MLSYADVAAEVSAAYSRAPRVAAATQIVRAGDNVRAVVRRCGGEVLVAIPGTTDAAGWARDLSAWPAWLPGLGFLHAGFGEGGVALWRALRQALPTSGVRIVFAGHSLGGALAQIAAAQCAAEGRLTFRCVTFGSPRVALAGNWRFSGLIARAIDLVLFSRNGDPIPELPFAPLYLHAGKLKAIGQAVAGAAPMTNHAIDRYLADVKALGV